MLSNEEIQKLLANRKLRPSLEVRTTGRSNPLTELYDAALNGEYPSEPEVIPEPDPNEPIIKEPIDTSNWTLKDYQENLYKTNPNYISGIDNPYLGQDISIPEEETPDSSNPFTTAVRGVSRGFAQTYITAAQGILAIADSATDAIGFEDAIDSEDGEIIKLLQEAREYIGHEEGMGGKLAEAIGSMLSLAVPGIGQAKFAAKVAAANMKGATGLKIAKQAKRYAKGMSVLKYTTAGGIGAGTSDEMLKAYKQAGGEYTTGQKNLTLAMGLGIGFSELLPIELILKGLPKYLDNNIKNGIIRKISNAVLDGGLEGVQEVGASLAQEYSAQMIYNPDQEIGESMLSDFGYGGAAGAIFSLFLRGKNRKIGRTQKDQKTLQDDFDNTVPSEPVSEKSLPKGKVISVYDTAGDEISGTVNNVDVENNTVSVTINDGADTIDIPLTPEINEQGYSLFSDEKLFNAANSLDIADNDGNVMNYPIGNPEKTTNEILEKEETRLNKLVGNEGLSDQDIFKLKSIRTELARREALTSDTISDPEKIDNEVNNEMSTDEQAESDTGKFVNELQDLADRNTEDSEKELNQRLKNEGIDVETGESIPIPKKYNNVTFDVPNIESNVAYNLGKRGKDPSKIDIEVTASDLDLTVNEFMQLSKSYVKDIQTKIKKQKKDGERYIASSFREYAEQNKPYNLRNNQINRQRKNLKISGQKFRVLINKVTGTENKKLEDLNTIQKTELIELMSQEKQKQDVIKNKPQAEIEFNQNEDGELEIKVKDKTALDADPFETIVVPIDSNFPNVINELEEKYNIVEEDKKPLLEAANNINQINEQEINIPPMDSEYFKALELATKNKTISVKSLQQKLFQTDATNIEDLKKTENLLLKMEQEGYLEPAKTDKPTSKRKVLQKFTTIDKAGEILIQETKEKDGKLKGLEKSQIKIANKIKKIIKNIAPGSKLKLANIIYDKVTGKEILGAQFKNIVSVALEQRGDDVTNAAYHEATHYLWNNGFFNEEQKKILLDNKDYLRQIVKNNIIVDPAEYDAIFSNLDEAGEMDELIAYTSGYYNASMDLTNKSPSFLTDEVSGILNNLYEMFKQLSQYVTGNSQSFTASEQKAITSILDNIRNGTIGNQSPSFNVDNPNPLARRQAIITSSPDAKYAENTFTQFSPLKNYLKQSQLKQKKKGSEWLSRNEKGLIIGALKKGSYKRNQRTYQVTNNELKETGLYNYLIKNPNEIISGQALLNIAKQNESLMIVNIVGEPTNDTNYGEVLLNEEITQQFKRNLYNYMITDQPVELLYALNEAAKSNAFNDNLLNNILKKYTNSQGELTLGREAKDYNLEELTKEILDFNLESSIKVDEVIDRWFNANTQLNQYLNNLKRFNELKRNTGLNKSFIREDPFSEEDDTQQIIDFDLNQSQNNNRILSIKLLTNTPLIKESPIVVASIEDLTKTPSEGASRASDLARSSIKKANILEANILMEKYGYKDEFLMAFSETINSIIVTNELKSSYINNKNNKDKYRYKPATQLENRQASAIPKIARNIQPDIDYSKYVFPGMRGLGVDNYQTIVISLPNINQEQRDPRLLNKEGTLDQVTFKTQQKIEKKISGKERNVTDFPNQSRANHFSNIANPLVFMRTTDMMTEDGQRILIIEEIQSDYATYIRDQLILDIEARIKNGFFGNNITGDEFLNTVENINTFDMKYRMDEFGESSQEAERNADKELRNFARNTALKDISGEQILLKRFLKKENIPSLPYLNQNDYLEFGINYIIQRASRESYDGIAIAGSELQNERYRTNFKNSIKGITFEVITLKNKLKNEPDKQAVQFSYTIPFSKIERNDANVYNKFKNLLFLDETKLNLSDYVFDNPENFNRDYNMTFENFLGKDITEILLNNKGKGFRGLQKVNDLPKFIEQNLPEGQTKIDGIDVTNRTDIPVGGTAFRNTYDVIIPNLLIKEMKASVPVNKRKTFAKEKKYLYTDGVSGFAKIINENEILDQDTIVTDTKETIPFRDQDINSVKRVTSNITNSLRLIPITKEMRSESKDAPPISTLGQARRMSVINNAKKERNNLSFNIKQKITNFFTKNRIFDPLFGVPEQRDYLLTRGKAMGVIPNIERITKKIRQDIAPYLDNNNPLKKKNHKKARETLYDFFVTNPKGIYTNENGVKEQRTKTEADLYQELKLLDPKMARTALNTKDIIQKLGEKLVEQNIIPATSYEMNKRNYLPKLYIDQVLKNPSGSARSYSQQRNKDKEAGVLAIDNLAPEFLISRAIQRPMRDLAMLEFYNSIAANKNWVLDGDLANVIYDGREVSFFWLNSQAKQYTNIAQYLDRDPERKAKLLKEADEMYAVAEQAAIKYAQEYNISDYKELFSQEHDESSKLVAPTGFKRVPNNKLYGLMAGKAVRAGIYEDVVASISYTAWGDNNYAKMTKLNRKLTSTWKLIKVPLNPPTVLRNIMSNAILMNLSGMPVRRMFQNMLKATKEILAYKRGDLANAKNYKDLLDRGVADTSFTESELFRWAEDFKEFTSSEAINELGPLAWLHLKGWKTLANTASSFYQAIEVIGKTAMAIEMVENQNKNADEAFLIAQDALFDYSLVSPTVRGLRTNIMGIPFLTFMYKVFPKLIDTAINHPFRFAPYVAIMYALPRIFMEIYDIDDEEYEKIQALLPEYTNAGTTLPIPYRDSKGRLQFLDLGYILPWGFMGVLLEQGKKGYNSINKIPQQKDFEPTDILQTLGLFGGPGWSAIGGILNIDPFSKRPIVTEGEPWIMDTQSDFNISIPGLLRKDGQLIDAIQYATNQWMLPSFLHTEYGAVNRLISAVNESGEINDKNRLTVTQAAIKFAGLNTFAIDENQAVISRKMFSFELQKLRTARRNMLKNDKLTREDKIKRSETYNQKIKDLKFKISLVEEITDLSNPKLIRTIKNENLYENID